MNVFKKYYNTEKNFSISCCWDGGFKVMLGDDINGYDSIDYFDTWKEVKKFFKNKLKEK